MIDLGLVTLDMTELILLKRSEGVVARLSDNEGLSDFCGLSMFTPTLTLLGDAECQAVRVWRQMRPCWSIAGESRVLYGRSTAKVIGETGEDQYTPFQLVFCGRVWRLGYAQAGQAGRP